MEYLISPLLQSLYHQTWQAGDAWWQEASHEVTWLFDYGVLWDLKNIKHNISSSGKTMAPSLEGEGAPHIKLNDH